MFDHIPVGVGSKGVIPINVQDLEDALEMGMDWSLREGSSFFKTMALEILINNFFRIRLGGG